MLIIGAIDSIAALSQAKRMSAQHVKGVLADTINKSLYLYSNESELDSIAARLDNLPSWNYKYEIMPDFCNFLKTCEKYILNKSNLNSLLDLIFVPKSNNRVTNNRQPFIFDFSIV